MNRIAKGTGTAVLAVLPAGPWAGNACAALPFFTDDRSLGIKIGLTKEEADFAGIAGITAKF